MRALVRRIPDTFADALTTVIGGAPIDVALARVQHHAYVAALESAGAMVTVLDADGACPDCVFVEDTAVVSNGVALITRPGAPSRRAETEPIAEALSLHLDDVRMVAPATLDGGECMRVGKTMYVGLSARTNREGIAQLEAVFGARVVVVDLPAGVLHLKCVCSPLAEDRVLLAERTLPAETFSGVELVMVPREEAYAANAVAVGTHVIVAAGYLRTASALARAGFEVTTVPASEVQKADGSLTCQSIVY